MFQSKKFFDVMWNANGGFLPLDVFDYTRVGGSVSHSA